jgi:Holliday junction DNA helicase RuvB
MEIDEHGLDTVDKMILDAIIIKFGGGSVGLETLAAAVSDEGDTLTDVYEPYLLKLGLSTRLPGGGLLQSRLIASWDIRCKKDFRLRAV